MRQLHVTFLLNATIRSSVSVFLFSVCLRFVLLCHLGTVGTVHISMHFSAQSPGSSWGEQTGRVGTVPLCRSWSVGGALIAERHGVLHGEDTCLA